LGPFDLVFIDGDHRYEGVKADWENYGRLGKVVVFHDIVRHPDGARNAPQVWRLWQELEGNKSQFIGPDSLMGLGVVCR
jgi:predicted O-methyltransferase YrrM